jgi:hypothetical protein
LRPFLGDWALKLPTGEVGWLAVQEEAGKPAASLMWAVGSVKPIQGLSFEGGALVFNRDIRPPSTGKEPAIMNRIAARIEAGRLRFAMRPVTGGAEVEFFGKRMPPLPPRPDLSKVRFGNPIALFNGRDLTGWRVSDPRKINGWSVRDGVLVNDTPKKDFGAYGDHANLLTEPVFTDFKLHIEYRLPAEGGNSGVYLRGMYEAQVTDRDSKMQGINGPGAIFGLIAPSKNAGKPGREWNSYDLILADRHVTVVLNGELAIDNQPVAGPTGGAWLSDVTQPGPIFLQGDHTAVEYRNIVLVPVLNAATSQP